MKVINTVLLFILAEISVYSQTSIDSVLASISKNNKTLIALREQANSERLFYKSENNLQNPFAEYDYLSGNTNGSNNQQEFLIAQTFDFPTAYVRKSQLADAKGRQADIRLEAETKEILHETRLICLDIIYYNKIRNHLDEQLKTAEEVYRLSESQLDKGNGNILDLNKAKLRLVDERTRYLEITSSMGFLQQQLNALNGGDSIIFRDTVYPVKIAELTFEQVSQQVQQNNPYKLLMESEVQVAEKDIQVSRAMSWPGFEGGFRYVSEGPEEYKGIHGGITIPLWENRNKVKMQKSRARVAEIRLGEYQLKYASELKQLFERYEMLRQSAKLYSEAFSSENNNALLFKALSLGQISAIEYHLEASYFNNSYLNYLKTENELFKIHAELFKFNL